jgi:hypothetical protein
VFLLQNAIIQFGSIYNNKIPEKPLLFYGILVLDNFVGIIFPFNTEKG